MNGKIEQYSNGLLSMSDTISSIFENHALLSNTDANASTRYIWKTPFSFTSAPSSITPHYVVRALAERKDPSNQQPMLLFENWEPGNSFSAVERETFIWRHSDPVQYWTELNHVEEWKPLAEIALRIISISPLKQLVKEFFSKKRDNDQAC